MSLATPADNYVFDEEQLLREHPGLAPHIVGGRRMHGGFHADGRYQPPRALVREPALRAWGSALESRGGHLLAADASLLSGQRMPTLEQSRVLLLNDLGQTFWNTLTITGKIEARGRLLADLPVPDLQSDIVDDISQMAIGHLGKGLLRAHGFDEGGVTVDGEHIGAHDDMWFVARDLAFGANAFDDVDPPENIARPQTDRVMPEVAAHVEGLLSLLMNLLIIEFRAEIGFADTQALLRDPELFVDRRREAQEAAELVGRIRIDEEIHVYSLRLYLGEFASVTFRTSDGGTVVGQELIDRFWSGLVQWATVDQPALAAAQQHSVLRERIAKHPHSKEVLQEFEAAA